MDNFQEDDTDRIILQMENNNIMHMKLVKLLFLDVVKYKLLTLCLENNYIVIQYHIFCMHILL